MKTIIKMKRFPTFLTRFRREEKGVAAVEGAVVLAMLSGAFVLMADLSVEAYTQNKLSNALRSSVQYIANQGRDLDKLDAMFMMSYGKNSASLDKKINCSCAKTREEFTINTNQQDPNATEEQPEEASMEVVAADGVQDGDGKWAQCDMTCASGPVIKYLELTGTDTIRNIVKNEEVTVDVKYSVRVE